MIKYYDFYFWNYERKVDREMMDVFVVKMDIAETDLEKVIKDNINKKQ